MNLLKRYYVSRSSGFTCVKVYKESLSWKEYLKRALKYAYVTGTNINDLFLEGSEKHRVVTEIEKILDS